MIEEDGDLKNNVGRPFSYEYVFGLIEERDIDVGSSSLTAV